MSRVATNYALICQLRANWCSLSVCFQGARRLLRASPLAVIRSTVLLLSGLGAPGRGAGLAVRARVKYFLNGKFLTEESLNGRCGRRPGSAGAAAGAAEPAGGPDAAAVVVPDRHRHRVGTGLRVPLHL